eukprot:1177517-Prorocentrum_minimum.AAC.3
MNVAPADVSLEDEATMCYNSMAESPLASFPAASSLDVDISAVSLADSKRDMSPMKRDEEVAQ